MIRAIIFDIDDTLQDWEAAIDQALQQVLPDLPRTLRGDAREHLERAIEHSYFVVREGQVVNREYWKLLYESLAVWRNALPDADPKLVDSIARRFQALLGPVPFADAQPVLEALRGQYCLATLSNNPYSEEWLRRLGLREYFEAVVPARGRQRKPHPNAFRRACRKLAIAPADGLYVGDSLSHDVEGALAVGLIPVWLDRYGANYALPPGAHRIVSLKQLPGLLAGLQQS